MAVADNAGVEVISNPERVSISEVRKKYEEAALARGATEAAEVVERAMNDFVAVCTKTYVDEINHDDVTRFQAAMRKSGLKDRTVYNRHANLRSFILFSGRTGGLLS